MAGKSLILFLCTLAISLSSAARTAVVKESQKGYYLLPEKIYKLQLRKSFLKPKTLQTKDGFSLVEMTDDQIDRMSSMIHSELGSCGGFFDVTDEYEKTGFTGIDFSSFAEKKEVKHNFAKKGKNKVVAPFTARGLKFVEQIKENLANVQKSRFYESWQKFVQFPERSSRSENGRKASLWLQNKAKDYARAANRTDVTVEAIPTGRRYKQDSVVVKIPGTNPWGVGGVLIGGHMDTMARGNMPGADDDASGTITVLEVFRGIIDSGIKFENDLYFSFYAAEEVGLVGSGVMARKFVERGVTLQAVMQLDMTAYLAPNETKELYFMRDYTTDSLTSWTRKLAVKVLDIPDNKIAIDGCGYACSDQASWKRQGYDTVYPFESSFRNHNRSIHTRNDALNRLSLDHAMKFVKLGFAFMYELGEPANAATVLK